METNNFWLIARDIAMAFVLATFLPLFFERGIALLHLSVDNGLVLQRVLGLAVLVVGTLVQNASLGIGFIAGGYWTMMPVQYCIIYGVSVKFFIILLVALAALIRALIVWDREYLENIF